MVACVEDAQDFELAAPDYCPLLKLSNFAVNTYT